MTAPDSRGLNTLTRRHAVKVAAAVSVEDCCLAIGEAVGHESILSASKMNNAAVIFLNTVEKANELVERGIVVDGLFTPVLPLSMPSKKVTLSNVPPFISDELLSQSLSRYGKLVSPIKKIPIGSTNPLLKHVFSFRRFAYMIVKDDAELDLTFKYRIDDFDYVVYAATGKMKCFFCSNVGHLIRDCPEKKKETLVAAQNTNDTAGPPETERPAVDRAESEAIVVEQAEPEAVQSVMIVEGESVNEEVNNAETTRSGEDEIVLKDLTVSNSDRIEGDEHPVMDMVCENVGIDSEAESTLFKMPRKRKNSVNTCDSKILKKMDIVECEGQSEFESDSESDSSVSLSQCEGVGRSYDLEEIKLFLKATKNRRGVRVNDYFPDLKQFVDKTRCLMAEGLFNNKEVYRLKKLVRKLNTETSDGAEKS